MHYPGNLPVVGVQAHRAQTLHSQWEAQSTARCPLETLRLKAVLKLRHKVGDTLIPSGSANTAPVLLCEALPICPYCAFDDVLAVPRAA